MKGYPKWFNTILISAVIGALYVSGLLLTPTTLESQMSWSVPWRLRADSRIYTAGIHALFAFLTFGLLGALWAIHMRVEWKSRKNRLSAIGLVSAFIFLGMTGIGIYYIGNEAMTTLVSISHAVVGVGILAPYLVHVFVKNR